MKFSIKISIALILLSLFAFSIPAMAQAAIYPTGDGTYSLITEAFEQDVSKTDGGVFTINMENNTLTGNLSKSGTPGTLAVEMDEDSEVIGTLSAADDQNTASINGGVITAQAGNNTLEVESGGAINLTETKANADGGSLIYSSTGGTVTATDSTLTGGITHGGVGILILDMTDNSKLIGNLANTGTSAGGTLDLYIRAGSNFTGAVSTNAARATDITVNEIWTVTDDSDLGLGNLDNSGVVDYMTNTAYMTVGAGQLGRDGATNGVFAMKMDIVTAGHDTLRIADSAAGSYIITAQGNDATAATSGRELFNMVELGGASTATFALDNENDIERGAWMYSLREIAFSTGTAWQIYSTGLSNAASAAVNTIAAGYLMGYAELNTLTQRLGELRETPYMSGFWAIVHGGKFNADGMSFGKEFDLKYGAYR